MLLANSVCKKIKMFTFHYVLINLDYLFYIASVSPRPLTSRSVSYSPATREQSPGPKDIKELTQLYKARAL